MCVSGIPKPNFVLIRDNFTYEIIIKVQKVISKRQTQNTISQPKVADKDSNFESNFDAS